MVHCTHGVNRTGYLVSRFVVVLLKLQRLHALLLVLADINFLS